MILRSSKCWQLNIWLEIAKNTNRIMILPKNLSISFNFTQEWFVTNFCSRQNSLFSKNYFWPLHKNKCLKKQLYEESFGNIDRNLSSHGVDARHNFLLVADQRDPDVDQLLQRHLGYVIQTVVSSHCKIVWVSTHLDGVEPVVDAGKGRVVWNVISEGIVHRTFGHFLQCFWTANLE